MKVLVVEDDQAGLLLLRRYLESLGQIDTAERGDEAIDLFQKALESKQPYDLVCLDIMLPGTSGQEALMAMRVLEQKHGILGLDRCKILMITALNDPSQILASFREQCDGYLPKPLFYNRLVEELAKLKIHLDPL